MHTLFTGVAKVLSVALVREDEVDEKLSAGIGNTVGVLRLCRCEILLRGILRDAVGGLTVGQSCKKARSGIFVCVPLSFEPNALSFASAIRV